MKGELTPEAKQQLMMRFGSRLVHDVAGPIDQISSLLALFIRRYKAQVDDEGNALLAHIDAARFRLANTGAGLRTFFRVITTDQTLQPVNLNEVAAAAVSSLRKQIADADAEVVIHDLPSIDGDPELLRILFQSLLENALKFRRNDEHPCVDVSAEVVAGRHVLRVADNGIGIDPANCEIVFEPFKKLNGQLYPGAGLGLALVDAIARMHGGTARLEPLPHGAVALVELPG
jgi:light-regulated signal transduction histidine kinase (bacteriophytochrome)